MVCFCFLVDQTRKVKRSKPAAGTCSRCGHCASIADMKTSTRFCFIPIYWRSWRAVVCSFCGSVLKSYRWIRFSKFNHNSLFFLFFFNLNDDPPLIYKQHRVIYIIEWYVIYIIGFVESSRILSTCKRIFLSCWISCN